MVSSKIQGVETITPLPGIEVEICLTSDQIMRCQRKITYLENLFLGTIFYIAIVNNVADNVCYEAAIMLKADKSLPRNLRKQGVHLEEMLRDYDARLLKLMGEGTNARYAFGTSEVADAVESQIATIEQEVGKLVGNDKLLTKVVLATMLETFAIANAVDRLKEFATESSQAELVVPFIHYKISKKMNTISKLLGAPEIVKELTLMSKFTRLQKQLLDAKWIADIMHKGVEENKWQMTN